MTCALCLTCLFVFVGRLFVFGCLLVFRVLWFVIFVCLSCCCFCLLLSVFISIARFYGVCLLLDFACFYVCCFWGHVLVLRFNSTGLMYVVCLFVVVVCFVCVV